MNFGLNKQLLSQNRHLEERLAKTKLDKHSTEIDQFPRKTVIFCLLAQPTPHPLYSKGVGVKFITQWHNN